MIVRVTHGERCLLARQPRFASGVRSVLAGFVEPGETLESAVVREVFEEVGLRVRAVSYFGSQPWPFPFSLMIAFTAIACDREIRIDAHEIESADWYSRDRVRRETADGTLTLPGANAISRQLIDRWLDRVP